MPQQHNRRTQAPRQEEADELVDLVEVVLRPDVVFVGCEGGGDGFGPLLRREVQVLAALELQDGGQGDGGGVEGDEEDAEDLRDVDVEGEVVLVVGCASPLWLVMWSTGVLWTGVPMELTVRSMCGLRILYHWKMLRRTARLWWTEQKGWKKEACGMKYCSSACCCVRGEPVVSLRMTSLISATGSGWWRFGQQSGLVGGIGGLCTNRPFLRYLQSRSLADCGMLKRVRDEEDVVAL